MSDESRRVDDEVSALIIVHESLLRHIISLNVDNPTDRNDVYQETVVAILEGFRKGKSVEHPKAWMAGIAKNKCADFHRRDERDTHRDIDLSSIISHTAFGGGVSITDDQHQAVVVKEIRSVISERFCRSYTTHIITQVATAEIEGIQMPFLAENSGNLDYNIS